jgi:hypothetical protein
MGHIDKMTTSERHDTMIDYTYTITARLPELGGGWRLRLLVDGIEDGGGVFPFEYDTEGAYDEAEGVAEEWLASKPPQRHLVELFETNAAST